MGLIVTPGSFGASQDSNLSFGSGYGDPMSFANTMASFGGMSGTPMMGPAGMPMAPAAPAMMPGTPANLAMPSNAAPMMSSMGGTGINLGALIGMNPGQAAPGAALPGAAGGAGWFNKIGGLEGIGSIASTLGDLGKLWGAFQGVKMARDQLNFSKDSYNTNLHNTTQDYNTSLEGKIRSQYRTEGRSSSDADRYLAAHSL